MAANTSYVDIGAIQRREAADGSPAANTSYADQGAIQREEAVAAGGRIMGSLAGHGGLAGTGGIAGKGGGLAA